VLLPSEEGAKHGTSRSRNNDLIRPNRSKYDGGLHYHRVAIVAAVDVVEVAVQVQVQRVVYFAIITWHLAPNQLPINI
jgi:hypothetical protein